MSKNFRVVGNLGFPAEKDDPNTPIMTGADVERRLEEFLSHGWRLVTYAQKHWGGSEPWVQSFWIFERVDRAEGTPDA